MNAINENAEVPCIWLTRPSGQFQQLSLGLELRGFTVHALPLLMIEPLPLNGVVLEVVKELDRFDFVIFVSTNAAMLGIAAITDWWPQFPAKQKYFAVGPSTAALLESHNLEVYYPEGAMNSEALLALPYLRDIRGKKVLIVRGRGGREILAKGLNAAGASVQYAEVYERHIKKYSCGEIIRRLADHPPSAIVISSGEALQNFHQHVDSCVPQWKELPLMPVSDRLFQIAKELGFTNLYTLQGASDDAILEALSRYFEKRR
jgi:uroporphyrinogen-III synthase